ncbi:PREDICTED: midasin-like [Ipomoea nil]|uniref:midasin-like n=1 Tax=Ipomoea nil TaxID=35883 RepID=UPI0009015DF6|nr:PREDICTED: midasin-like [Ipomoea nil]
MIPVFDNDPKAVMPESEAAPHLNDALPVTNRTLGKEKALVCIELKKPPLDPVFEEEMKEFRLALLLSKVKTVLEKSHQNDPACNISGSKDDNGKEIEDDVEVEEADAEDERVNEDEDSNDDESTKNESPNEGNNGDEDDDGENNDDENDDKRDDDEENEKKKDDDQNDDIDDDDDDDENSDYDSESPIIGNTELIPDRSPTPHSSPPKDTPPRDPSPSVSPPTNSQNVANPASDGKMEASPRDGKMEASPRDGKLETSPREHQVILEHRNALRKLMSVHPEQGYNFESLDPENIMQKMLNTVHQAELIHQQLSKLSNSPCADAKKGKRKEMMMMRTKTEIDHHLAQMNLEGIMKEEPRDMKKEEAQDPHRDPRDMMKKETRDLHPQHLGIDNSPLQDPNNTLSDLVNPSNPIQSSYFVEKRIERTRISAKG